jgi:hypothetical protein
VKGAAFRVKNTGNIAANKSSLSKETTLFRPTLATRDISHSQIATRLGSVISTSMGDTGEIFQAVTEFSSSIGRKSPLVHYLYF